MVYFASFLTSGMYCGMHFSPSILNFPYAALQNFR